MPDGEEDVKLIGVYATAEDAEAARQRVLPQPGFRELPEGFEVSRYGVGKPIGRKGISPPRMREICLNLAI